MIWYFRVSNASTKSFELRAGDLDTRYVSRTLLTSAPSLTTDTWSLGWNTTSSVPQLHYKYSTTTQAVYNLASHATVTTIDGKVKKLTGETLDYVMLGGGATSTGATNSTTIASHTGTILAQWSSTTLSIESSW